MEEGPGEWSAAGPPPRSGKGKTGIP
jgi:hypothetical protein